MKTNNKNFAIVLFLCFISTFIFTGSSASTNNKFIKKWPNGIIPYYIPYDFTQTEVISVVRSMHRWEESGVVLFVPRTEQEFFVCFEKNAHSINSATIGYRKSNSVKLYNFNSYIIDHELGHCLGLVHEHQRPDRDKYVTISWTDITKDREHNFVLYDSNYFLYDYKKYPYDFKSIMHYGEYDFSKNGKRTIVVKDKTKKINCFNISNYDLEKIVEIYGE